MKQNKTPMEKVYWNLAKLRGIKHSPVEIVRQLLKKIEKIENIFNKGIKI